jgi:hypothetical protein
MFGGYNLEHIQSYLKEMFSSTQHLFAFSTTWQYMLISVVVTYTLLLVMYAISKTIRYEFRLFKALKKLLYYANYIVLSIGTLFYGMVLFKKMWALA